MDSRTSLRIVTLIIIIVIIVLPPAPVAVENSEKSLSKLPVHKAVCDGIATGADVGEQLHERHASTAHCPVHGLGIESVPRVEHV